ncbi:MAG TPA: HEAT repeat domain-containing protein [Gemmatimonadaceae bacterium]|nr:HEAT repeat domain-containing protein [Gemmatimonadaceae bacterium]
MSRTVTLSRAVVALGTLVAVAPAGAQSLAARIAAAPAGEVRMSYATRSGVCGDGKSVVAFGQTMYMDNTMESYGRWSGVNCKPGGARVTVRTGASGVEAVRTRIGGSWESASGAVTDLGVVSAPAAASYLLDVAEKLPGKAGRYALLAAVVADSIDINDRLLAIARRSTIARETRQRAVHWLGELGDASLVAPLTALAQGDDSEEGVGMAAVYALTRLPGGVGIPTVIDLARNSRSREIRERAVFWLGQSEDPRGRREVRAIAADASAPSGVRAKAVFALGHGDASTPEDFAFLRDLFGKVDSDDIRNHILMAMAQSDDAASRKWLLDVARDERAPLESRKKAIFWAGQSDVPVSDIVAVYDAARDEELKEHTIFVLSQRDDKAATDKLLSIVRSKEEPELRKKALFWLAQKHDPAITRMISDMITKQ